MSTGHSYDRVAERYAVEIGDELAGKPLDRALLAALVELAEGPVADLGCGPGHVTAFLSAMGASAVGLDLSVGMCTIGRRTTRLPYAAGDLTALPLRDDALGGAVCLYAVIHLDEAQRALAYRELARVLRPGGRALIAFHTSDADVPTGGALHMDEWWDERVDLTFRYLDPLAEVAALEAAGLVLAARLDREPAGDEHASRRSYLVVRRP